MDHIGLLFRDLAPLVENQVEGQFKVKGKLD